MSSLDYYDPEWVAEKLGLDRNTVYKYLQEGIIPSIRVGKKWLISESKLVDWLEMETKNQTDKRREAAASAAHTVGKMDNYSSVAREIIKQAHSEARRYVHKKLGQEHLVLAMAGIMNLGVKADKVRSLFENFCEQGEGSVPRRLGRSPDAKKAMRLAAAAARDSGSKEIQPEHLLQGILETREGIGFKILSKLGIKKEKVS